MVFNNAALQSIHGKIGGKQGNPCNQNMIPCIKSSFFPVRIRAQGNPIFIIGHGFAVYLTRAVEAVPVQPPLTHIPNCMVRYVPKNKRATLSYTDGTVNVVFFLSMLGL